MAITMLALLIFQGYSMLLWLAIDHRPPRADESTYFRISEYSFRQLKAGHPIAALNLKTVTDTKPGMVGFLSALTYFVVGHDEHTAIFIVNLSSDMLIAFLLLWMSRMMYGFLTPGLLAYLWLQSLAGIIVWSGYYQIDLPLTAACTLTAALCLYLTKTRFTDRLATIALLPIIAIGLAVKHLYAAFVAPTLLVLLLLALAPGRKGFWERVKARRPMLASITIGVLLGLVYHLINIHIVIEQLHRAVNPPDQGPLVYRTVLQLLVMLLPGHTMLYGLCFACGCIVALSVSGRLALFPLSLIAGGWIGVTYATKQPGSYYLFPFLPAFGFMLASVLAAYRFFPKGQQRYLKAASVAVGLCLAVFFAGVHLKHHLGTANPIRLIRAASLLRTPPREITTNPFSSEDYWSSGILDGNTSLLPYPNDWKLDEIVAKMGEIAKKRGSPARVALLVRWTWMSDYNVGYKLYKAHLDDKAVLGGGTPLWSVKTQDDIFTLGDIFLIKEPNPFESVEYWQPWVKPLENMLANLTANGGQILRAHGYAEMAKYPLPDHTFAYLWYRAPDPDVMMDSFETMRIAPLPNTAIKTYMECEHRTRQVLFEPPVAPPGIATVDWPVHLRPGARLKFGIGLGEDVWDSSMGDGVDFQISLVKDGKMEQIFSKYIDPKNVACDRRWFDFDVPLKVSSPGAGFLRFVTTPGPKGDFISDHAGWSDPRIVY